MKKQVRKLFLTASVALLVAPASVYAHPGRTDANGGHTCRTNCEKWGLQYGEYHYHNKPASNNTTNSTTSSQNNGAAEAKAQQKAEEQRKAEEERQRKEEAQRQAEEERQRKEEAQRQAEIEKGQADGQKNGETDFQAGKNNVEVHIAGKSEAYKQAFTHAYSSAWLLAEQRKGYFEKGKEQGLAQETMDNSQVAPEFKANFAEGFQIGNKERTEKIKKEQEEIGKKDGETLAEKNPRNNEKEEYVKAYEAAYEKSYKNTKKRIEKEGYTYAFENYDLKVPSKYKQNDLQKKWFTEGFHSNKKAKKIREEGYKKGDSWLSFFYKRFVPSEYKEHKELYKQAIEKGESA
ncbi:MULTISPECIES: YHYH domain-containing protein [Bacillus cereus group]|uniref:YHYH domain-containing protein n=1 Tax=Bacillus cereus group TaxID=86661 RepID=UPI0006603DC9|nr:MULTISPECIES: YHYH domain-containing protein [Bacillus cereus group]AWC31574.1 YHYH domain-containing protein [Bacillus cytotoxicus]AWC35614.1 YHYH domain-containing protein [Bacillus cytotoxicus]AWC59846.1 YHYH domain-containing protein [Bacillus cytotoxicus]KMT49955.1 ribosomal protein L5-like protein [Bacillus cytotoxicus]MDH2880041.1 YHYH domain-containing protein [Bacillus cytotoxicus]